MVVVSASEGSTFLDACAGAEVVVLGAEGFDVQGATVRPDMGAILDLSGIEDPQRSILEAKRFVEEVDRPGLMLEFVLEASPGSPLT